MEYVLWGFVLLGLILLVGYRRSKTSIDRSRQKILRQRLEAIERGDLDFVEQVPMPSDSTAAERELERAAIERKKRELGR